MYVLGKQVMEKKINLMLFLNNLDRSLTMYVVPFNSRQLEIHSTKWDRGRYVKWQVKSLTGPVINI